MLNRLFSQRLLKYSISYEGYLKYISSSLMISSIYSFSPLSTNLQKYFQNSSTEVDEAFDFLEVVLKDKVHYAFSRSLTSFNLFYFLADCQSIQSVGGSWFRKVLQRRDEAIDYQFLTFRVRKELTVICLDFIYCYFANRFWTCFSNCSQIFFVSALYFQQYCSKSSLSLSRIWLLSINAFALSYVWLVRCSISFSMMP